MLFAKFILPIRSYRSVQLVVIRSVSKVKVDLSMRGSMPILIYVA